MVVLRSDFNRSYKPSSSAVDPDAIVNSATGTTGLLNAIDKKDFVLAQRFLKDGADPDKPDNYGRTPLMAVASLGHDGMIDALINAGADIKRQANDGTTALMAASTAPDPFTTSMTLMRLGADPNQVNARGQTALHAAAAVKDAGLLQLFLRLTANPSQADHNGMTPLLIAARRGTAETVKALVVYGADLAAVTPTGDTALHLAATQNNSAVAEYLLTTKAIHLAAMPNTYGSTPLHLAAENGHVHLAQAMIAAGAGINTPDKNGLTPLHLAIRQNHFEMARWLLDHGAVINDPKAEKPEAAPLMALAARANNIGLLQLLIARGADVNVCDDDGTTPLMTAVLNDNRPMIGALLDAGANAKTTNDRQRNVLHFCRPDLPADIVDRLLAAGADIDARENVQRRTPLMMALGEGNGALADLLMARGASLQGIDSGGFSTLHLALNSRLTAQARKLLHEGINPNTRSRVTEETPLHTACRTAPLDVIKTLLEKKADVNAQDHHDQTPLHAAAGSFLQSLEKATLLCEKGADPWMQDIFRNMPSEAALRVGNRDAAAFLKNTMAKKPPRRPPPNRYWR